MTLQVPEGSDIALDIETVRGALHGPTRLVAPVGPAPHHRSDYLRPLRRAHPGGDVLQTCVRKFGHGIQGGRRDLRFGFGIPVGENDARPGVGRCTQGFGALL